MVLTSKKTTSMLSDIAREDLLQNLLQLKILLLKCNITNVHV